ncbi:iron-sulfur cluster repair protein YtfE [Cellvibrio sp. OA-2007]|uniref:iron-sulfur cluster repair protein YtfE n=1 Tax=Cellvibrio sp. OA-2007 TaxID=529823 RepID=UPI000785713E|nr:iron-sulfur cluster repair protein YtfE [Cellvibrio sp. OA-2007]
MMILDQSLGQLARSIPGGTAVFHKYQLDFCCGGKKSLRDALSDRELNPAAIVAELQALQAQPSIAQEWVNVPDVELIEHILTRYHDVHRQQLPELIRLAQRVELVHGGHTECPAGLAQHLETMLQELENHMQKEEQILFPMISRGITGMAIQPIAMMRSEHDDHGAALADIEHLTRGITIPKGACNTWRALYFGLETLKADLMDHIHLENNILFDRIDGALKVNHG